MPNAGIVHGTQAVLALAFSPEKCQRF